MKTQIYVNNHMPVALRPLTEVEQEAINLKMDDVIVYVDTITYEENTSGVIGRWCVWTSDGILQFFEGDYQYVDGVDLERSTGRLLQPGERLVVLCEN